MADGLLSFPYIMRSKLVASAIVAFAAFFSGCAAEEAASEEEAPSQEDDLTAAPPLGPEPRGSAVRHPIILHHGFAGSTDTRSIWSFYKVRDALLRDGHPIVHEAQVAPFNGIEVRAVDFAKHVELARSECKAVKSCDPSKVHVIAHSYGGLDARHYVKTHNADGHVLSVTTIASPHRGSYLADVGLELLGQRSSKIPGPVRELAKAGANKFAELLAGTFTLDELAKKTDLIAALEDLSEENGPKFNAEHPLDPKVTYWSYAGVSERDGDDRKAVEACGGAVSTYKDRHDDLDLLLVAGGFVTGHFFDKIPNDGISTVASSKLGTFKGCIAMDHLDEVGQPKHDGPLKRTGFDHIRFYRNVAFDLQRLEVSKTR